MSYTNADDFTSSFLIWMPFISFSYLIALARASSTVFSISGEGGHTCLDLKGKAFSFFTIEYDVSCGIFTYVLYYIKVSFFYI